MKIAVQQACVFFQRNILHCPSLLSLPNEACVLVTSNDVGEVDFWRIGVKSQTHISTISGPHKDLVRNLKIGANGLLYSNGDDGLVVSWKQGASAPGGGDNKADKVSPKLKKEYAAWC